MHFSNIFTIPKAPFVVAKNQNAVNQVINPMDATHFPTVLHNMLTAIEKGDEQAADIVSWQKHGRCFMIRNKQEFIAKILPK